MEEVTVLERRRAHRHPVLKHARIILGHGAPDSICSIRNITVNGAELSVGADQTIPDIFMLFIRIDDRAYKCRIRWRIGTRLGVEFLEGSPIQASAS